MGIPFFAAGLCIFAPRLCLKDRQKRAQAAGLCSVVRRLGLQGRQIATQVY